MSYPLPAQDEGLILFIEEILPDPSPNEPPVVWPDEMEGG